MPSMPAAEAHTHVFHPTPAFPHTSCGYTCTRTRTQMIIDAPEQTVALGSDAIRQLMGQRTNTMPGKIFVYSTRTINNPKGQPSTSVRGNRPPGCSPAQLACRAVLCCAVHSSWLQLAASSRRGALVCGAGCWCRKRDAAAAAAHPVLTACHAALPCPALCCAMLPQITYLIKNTLDVERSRQASTFGSADINNGFMRDVAKATKLQIAPGSIKVSSAVNDGGMGAPAAPGAGLPGQLPGQMPGQMMPGAAMGMPGVTAGAPAAAAPAPAAPAKSGASHAVAGVLTAGAVLFAAVLVF